MARSNSYSFSMNRNELVANAYRLVNVYGLNDTISNADMAQANILLNSMIKSWEARDVPLWKRKQAYLFTDLNTYSYQVGPTGWHCTESYVSTTLSATEASGQTALSVTSSSGMTAGDFIGIELDDGTRQWTTITTVDSSVLVTVNTALTGQASSGNTVLSYTTKVQRPLRILRSNSMNIGNSNHSESTMKPISYDQYFNFPVKSTAGQPCNFYYDKLLDNGTLYVFPAPNNVKFILVFTYHQSIMDMNSATDDFDFPQEWTECLLYNLAVKLAAVKGRQGFDDIKAQAAQLFSQLSSFDSDTEDLRIRIKTRR